MRASSLACVLSAAVLCFAAEFSATSVRIPKRVRVEIDRLGDAADGTARVGPAEYAVLEYHETPEDEYRAAVPGCAVFDLEATVAFCDCRAACGRPGPVRGTSARVNFDLFLYARGDATYFSAAVAGDVVAAHETGTAVVAGARLDRLFGPHRRRRWSPAAETTRGDGTDAIDGRAFGEWLRRQFSDRRDLGGAGEEATDAAAAAAAGGGCADVQPAKRRGAGFRRALTAVGCLRAFSGKRCAGDSKTLLSAPEASEEEQDAAAPFPVESVTDCGCRRLNRPSSGSAAAPDAAAPALQCSCDCGSPANSNASGGAERTTPVADGSPAGTPATGANVSTRTDPAPSSAVTSADDSATKTPPGQSSTTGSDAGPDDVSAKPAAVVSAVESLPGSTADASTQTDPEFFSNPEVAERPAGDSAKTSASGDRQNSVSTGSAAEPLPDVSTGPEPLNTKTERLRGTNTVPERSTGAAVPAGRGPITFGEVVTRMADDALRFVTALAMAVGSFLWSAYKSVDRWSQ